MNAGHQDARRLDTPIVGGAPTRLVGQTEVATLSVSASSKDNAVHVSASNLDLHESVELELALRGGDLRDVVGTVLTADVADTWNSPARPDAVVPAAIEVTVGDGTVRVEIPPLAFVTVRGALA